MAGVFVSPGVYAIERDFSDYAPALATSIFGVVGGASWGPINDLTNISNENALINTFGKPAISGGLASLPAINAGIHYMRQGNQFIFVRVADGAEAKATYDLLDDGTEAVFDSSVDLTGGVDLSTNKFAAIDIGNAGPVTVDLSAGASVASAVTRAEILANLDAALSGVTNAALAGGSGEEFIRMTTTAAGSTAEIEFVTPPGNAATSATLASAAETYNLQFATTPHLDLDFDNSGTQTVTLGFLPATATSAAETYVMTGSPTLTFDLKLPGQTALLGVQTVSFVDGDFSVPGAATAQEVVDVINTQAVGLSAIVTGSSEVQLVTDKKGNDATISSIGGTAATALTMPASSTHAGTDDVADATIVTAAEIAAVVTALPPAGAGTAIASGGVVTLTSGTTGSSSEVDVITDPAGIFGVQTVVGLDVSAPLDATLIVFGVSPTSTTNGTGPFATIDATALYDGTRGNDISIKVETGTTSGTKNYVVVVEGLEVERFNNLLQADVDAVVSEWVVLTDLGTSTENPVNGTFALVGGLDGASALDAADYIGTSVGNTRTGLQLYADAESLDVNILAVPGVSTGAVIAALDTICSSRGDAMFIADPPSGEDTDGVIDWHNGTGIYTSHAAFNTSYGATYWSWMTWYDNYNQSNVLVPPSGFLSAIMAFTDRSTDPWFAPAGLDRGRIPEALSVEHSPDQGERDRMYSGGNAVNPIVNHRNFGVYVKGQRTLQRTATALDRVNVRRLLLYLRKIVATSVVRLEFEPNDASTRQRFINIVTPFLDEVQARRGLEAYSVIMDESTNPPSVVNRNEMRGKILLKPTKTAEIIVVEFTLLPSGASFSEAI